MSDAQLIAEMRRIIHGAADKLEELSVKSVRLALETKFQCDLSSRKEFVRAEVEKAVSALDAPEAPSSKPTAAPKVATKSDKVSETAVKPRRVVESTTTAVSAVEQERLAERARLKAAAVRSGMVSMQKQNAVPANVLAETSKANVKALRKLDGQDIVCKGSRAATKYVFQLPGYLDMSQMTGAGGVFGEIADMNTPNPLLYIDFPQGRLKLLGTVLYPAEQLLAISYSEKGNTPLQCKGDIRSVIVFPEFYWIGSAEQNQSETPLPLPDELTQLINAPVVSNTAADELGLMDEIDLVDDDESVPSNVRRSDRTAATARRSLRERDSDEDIAEPVEEPKSSQRAVVPKPFGSTSRPSSFASSQITSATKTARPAKLERTSSKLSASTDDVTIVNLSQPTIDSKFGVAVGSKRTRSVIEDDDEEPGASPTAFIKHEAVSSKPVVSTPSAPAALPEEFEFDYLMPSTKAPRSSSFQVATTVPSATSLQPRTLSSVSTTTVIDSEPGDNFGGSSSSSALFDKLRTSSTTSINSPSASQNRSRGASMLAAATAKAPIGLSPNRARGSVRVVDLDDPFSM